MRGDKRGIGIPALTARPLFGYDLRMRRSFLIFAFLVAGNQALLRAEAPAWYMEPVVTHDLQMDKKLPGGIHYLSEGSTVRVLIDPEKCATKLGALGLELESDGVMSRCTIVVARGGTFRSVGGTFNDVGFICQPGGVIELENCSLGMVYITHDIKSPAGGQCGQAEPQGLHAFQQPYRIRACVLSDGEGMPVRGLPVECDRKGRPGRVSELFGMCVFQLPAEQGRSFDGQFKVSV